MASPQFIPVAFVPVYSEGGQGWGLGIAEKDMSGYRLYGGLTFTSDVDAQVAADKLNLALGMTPEEAIKIVLSSMRIQGGRRR